MTKKRSKTKFEAEFPALAEKLLETVIYELEKEKPRYDQVVDMIAGFPLQMAAPVLTRAAKANPKAVLRLLEELLNNESDGIVLAAVAALGLTGLPEAFSALSRLEDELLTHPKVNVELKKAVSRSLHRLKSSGLNPSAAPGSGKTAQITAERRFHRCLLSSSDGYGTIQGVLSLLSPGGKLETAIVLLNDSRGIIQTRLYTFNQRQYDSFLAEWDPEVLGIRLVGVERDYLNYLVQKHLALNQRNKLGLPQEFIYWQRYFETPQQDYTIHPVYREIPPDSIREALAVLLPQTEKLLQTPEARHWYFHPQQIREDAEQLLERRRSRIVLTSAFLAEYVLKLAQDSIGRIFTEDFLPLYTGRLEHLAHVYLLSGQKEYARLALAAALDLKSGKGPGKSPFLISLAVKSLEALADLLESGEQPETMSLDLSAT